MIKEKKSGKLIARITTPQAFHLLKRTKTEGKTQSDIIRELLENDKATFQDKEKTAVAENNTNL